LSRLTGVPLSLHGTPITKPEGSYLKTQSIVLDD